MYQKDKKKLQHFVKENEGFRHMKPDAYSLIMQLSHTKQLDIAKESYNVKGEIDMCQAIDEMIADAKFEGKLEGIREGKLEGIREGKLEGIREEKKRRERERNLFALLVKEHRYLELERATQEDSFRMKLMNEYE